MTLAQQAQGQGQVQGQKAQ